MGEADDAAVEQARQLCDRAAHAVQEANQTLQFARMSHHTSLDTRRS